MIDNHNPYNQQPPVMSPPLFPMPPVSGKWQQYFLSGNSGRPLSIQKERSIPDWLVGRSVLFFFVAFLACTFVWGYPMEMRYAVVASLSLIVFFYGGKVMSDNWAKAKEHAFVRNVFLVGFLVRFLWVCYCYLFFNPDCYGTTYGDGADVEWYMPFGEAIAQWIRDGFPVPFGDLMKSWDSAIDDVGYPIWLAILSLISFGESDVFLPFVVKCIVGAICAISIYHISKRHFGDGAARMSAIFVALNPNMIYWCGNMFKETEMVFLCCLCVDLMDKTFTSGSRLTFKGLLPGVLVGLYIFFFRAALGIVIYLAMFAHIVMASNRVMSAGKKVIAGLMVGIVLLIGMGDRLRTQTESIMEAVQSDQQEVNMKWRSEREGGNQFAKYAGKTIFAPLIFTIPFPTFNMAYEGQILQTQLSGGNYIKNIFSYFVILIMVLLLINGEWRRHVFILAYTLGYLVTLVLSNFAHSSRFHMPIWPMLMLFAAYGIQLAKTTPRYKRWFTFVLVLEVFICLGWNWFKLKGRGMI